MRRLREAAGISLRRGTVKLLPLRAFGFVQSLTGLSNDFAEPSRKQRVPHLTQVIVPAHLGSEPSSLTTAGVEPRLEVLPMLAGSTRANFSKHLGRVSVGGSAKLGESGKEVIGT